VIPTLSIADTNARQGFLSPPSYEALRSNVEDPDLRDFVKLAWSTAMRKSEVAKLTWKAFDRETWTITLHARDAKTRKGRVLGWRMPCEIIERRLKARRLDAYLPPCWAAG